jgi:hypothetical protein
MQIKYLAPSWSTLQWVESPSKSPKLGIFLILFTRVVTGRRPADLKYLYPICKLFTGRRPAAAEGRQHTVRFVIGRRPADLQAF